MATNDLLPSKSRESYENCYSRFMDWRLKNQMNSFSENVLIAYFQHLSEKMKPSSLWTFYSMLRSTLNIKNNIHIEAYSNLIALLKRKSDGFKSIKSKTLTTKNIQDFLETAPDNQYLFMKTVLIIGVSGACRTQELRDMKIEDVEDTGKSFIIKIPNRNTKIQRSFVISDHFYTRIKKYYTARKTILNENLPFFIKYINGKCMKQPVGKNKLGSVPKDIAKFLKLENPNRYTGHSFGRFSATILVDAGRDLERQSSSVAEGYVDNSLKNKELTSLRISFAILHNSNTTSTNENITMPYDSTHRNTSNIFNN